MGGVSESADGRGAAAEGARELTCLPSRDGMSLNCLVDPTGANFDGLATKPSKCFP
jgi:hypothetical protein